MKKNAKEIRFVVLHGVLVALLLTLLVITACFKDDVIVVEGNPTEAAEQMAEEE